MTEEFKQLGPVTVKDYDAGVVEAAFSKFNTRDLDGDVTLKEAFTPNDRVKISAYNHGSWDAHLPVGVGTIQVRDDCAVLQGRFFMNTTAGRDTFEVVKGLGDLGEWSYGFTVADQEFDTFEGKQSRILKKVNVYEVSPVLKGAGIGTGTLSVKSDGASFSGQCEQVLTQLESLTGRGAEILVKRREEGKSLGNESSVLLTRIRDELTRLEDLVTEEQPQPTDTDTGQHDTPQPEVTTGDEVEANPLVTEWLRYIASQHGLAQPRTQ